MKLRTPSRKASTPRPLRSSLSRFSSALAVCAALATAAKAGAASQTWDPNVNQGGTGGTGTWDAGATALWTGPGGVGDNQSWINGNDASFGGIGGGPFTVTVNNTNSGPVTVGSITFQSAGYTVTGDPVTLTGANTITTAADATINSILQGGGASVNKLGAGNLTLGGANTFNGLTINAGTVTAMNSGSALGAGTVNVSNAGTLVFAPGTATLTYANTITGGGNITLNGSVAGAPAGVILSGTNSGFTGSYTLNQGRLVISTQANLGATTAPVTVNGTSSNGGQLWVNANVTVANPVTLNGYGPSESTGNLGAIRFATGTYSGAITLGSNASLNPQGAAATVSGPISGGPSAQLLIGTPITGTGAGNVGGTLAITSANNTYSGGTLIQGATAAANAVGALGTGAIIVSTTSNSALTESVANALTGSNSLTVNGGLATLSTSNNYSGVTTVTGGTLTASAAGAIPAASAVTVSGGTLNNNAAGAILGPITVAGGTFAQTAALNTVGQTLTVTSGTANLSQANTFSGLTSVTGGTLNASIAGAVGGPLSVAGGKVSVSAVGGIGAATVTSGILNSSVTTGAANSGLINLNGGTMTSAPTGGTFGAVAGGSSANAINPGGVGAFGAMTIGQLSTGSGTTLQFDILAPYTGAPAATGDVLTVSGSNQLSLGAGTTLGFAMGTPTAAGNYRLIGYTGAAPSLPSSLLPASPRSGITYALDTVSDPGFIDLKVAGSAAAVNASFLPTAAGSFSYNTASNWSGGVVPNLAGDSATFAQTLAGPQTVTLDGQQHVGALALTPGSATAYTIAQGASGGTLYLDNGAGVATVTNSGADNTISAPVYLVSNTNFALNAARNLTLSGGVTGAGKLLTGAGSTGTLTLTGAGSYTGGTELDGGTLAISAVGGTGSQLNNAGVGVTTLNGGTLSFTATTGQTTTPNGFVINVGSNGGTLNVSGTGVPGKLLMVNSGQFTGSGTLTKTGGGDLQVNGTSAGFTGNVNVNGLIEVQAPGALGTVGTLTVNSGGEVASTGQAILNPITLNGGTLSANSGTNQARYTGVVTVTSPSTLAARQFQGTSTPENFAIETLAGSGNLSIVGNTTGAPGMVTLGNASAYTGTIAVGANGVLGIGSGANFFGSSNAITVVPSGGIGLVADGDGTGSRQNLAFVLPANAINFAAGNTVGYFVGAAGANPTGNLAANKTIAPTTALPNNATNTLSVTPVNGFGLLLANQPTLTGTQTYNVNGVQASNVVPGLTLTNLTGGFGIVKTGTGTLQLGTGALDTSNTFGAPSTIDIQGGTVAAASVANLGNGNAINLNNTTAAEFLAEGSFTLPAAQVITLATATGGTIGVSSGNTLTLASGLNYAAAGNTLTKVENGTLVLTAAASNAPSSGTTINAGALSISNSNQLGSGTITVGNNLGAALQVTGGLPASPTIFTQPLNLSSGGIQGRGALENVSGASTFTGAITMANAGVIGNDDAANTLTLGVVTPTGVTSFAGPGQILLTGAIGNGTVQVLPGASVNSTAADANTGLSVLGGNFAFSGASGANGNSAIGVGFGGTLTFDNTTANLVNRNSIHTIGFGTVGGGGTIKLLGNANAPSSENFFGFATNRGQELVQVAPGANQSATITLTNTGGAFNRAALSTLVYQAPGLGSAAASGVGVINEGVVANTGFQGAATAGGSINQQVQPWALANDTNQAAAAMTFATASGATGQNYRLLAGSESAGGLINANGYAGSSVGTATVFNTATINVTSTSGLLLGEAVSGNGIPAGAYITALTPNSYTLNAPATLGASTSGVVLNYSTTGANVTATTPISSAGITLSPSINSLTLATGGTLTLGNSQTLLVGGTAGGGILATDPSGSSISGLGAITAGTSELIVHTVGNLTISSAITGGAGGTGVGLTKGDAGTLTLAGKAFYNGQTVVNQGNLVLNAGNNTIQFANYLTPQGGSTVNLNGNSQIVTDLLSDNATVAGYGIVGGSGTVTGGAASSTLVVKGDGTSSRNFTGTITGGLSLLRASGAGATTWGLTQNETYTGATLIAGGTVQLSGAGALSGTTSLSINRAGLTLDNNTGQDVSARVPVGLPVALAGGAISYIGRTQNVSAESLGVINANDGANTISVTQQTVGVSSATLTLAGLNRSLGSTVNFTNTGGTLGGLGSNPQIIVSSAPALTSGIIGGGYVVNGNDFASYGPTGVGGLSASGFQGYSPNPINTAASTDNVSMASSSGAALNNETINSLRVTGGTTLAFNPGQTLTLATGGLLSNANLTVGSAVNNGSLTSGTGELFLYTNGTAVTTINSAVVGAVALVKSGGSSGATTLAGTNSYTGGTYVNQGTLTLGSTGQLGTGGIFLNGGTLVQTAGGVIPTQAVSISGAGALTLAGNNTVSTLAFNNNGGVSAPNLTTTGGVLTISSGSITASAVNVGTTSIVSAGTLDLANAATPTLTVNPISFNGQNIAPLQPTLIVNAAIQNAANPVSVTGGGNLQLGGASIFSGGVNLTAGTSLTVAANSTNMASGQPLSGPLGTGRLNIASGSTLLPDAGGSRTVGNNVVINGAFTFDASTNAAASLTLGAAGSSIALPGGATSITVNAPNMTGGLGGSVTGTGSSIVKNGLGVLLLNNGIGGASTFDGGVTINAGTVLATGVGASGTSLGSGPVTINGGLLSLHHSGQANNSVINYGNNVVVNSSLANAFIDINNNGANTGNTIVMGNLGYTGFNGSGAAPSTVLNVTGGNSYKLQFTGTTLTGASSSPVFNVASGLSLILPGGFNVNTNLPTNIGAGSLLYSGSNVGAVAAPISGTVAVAPLIAQSSTPLGTGNLTLNGGSTLQISPLFSSAISTTGYTPGGMLAKYYNTGATTMATAGNFGVAPGSVLAGVLPNDVTDRQSPAGVNTGVQVNTIAVYQALLNVANGGTYYFGGGSDDQLQISVDGQVVQQDIASGHGIDQRPLQSIALASGVHQIVVRSFNNAGGGGVQVLYGGPDTAAGNTGTPPLSGFVALPLAQLAYAQDYTAANHYQNAAVLNNALSVAASAAATVDGLGTDFNSAVPTLTLNDSSTLTVANGTGAAGSFGNGAFIVTGTTTLGVGTTLSPTTGTLVLAGGVSDSGNGLTKTGAGNLVLGSSSSFSGPLNINNGFVQLASGTSLTTGTTTVGVAGSTPATLGLNGQTVTTTGDIILNGGAGPAAKSSAAPAGLYNSSATTASLPAGGTLSIGAPIGGFNATIGGFGDIVLNGTVRDSAAAPGSGWNKVGPDVLTLNGSNTFTGQLNINGGTVQLGNTTALGTNAAAAVVVASGAALDLNGQTVGVAKQLQLSGAGVTALGRPNTAGALINSSSSPASYAGPIVLNAATSVGGPSLAAGTNGDITLTGAITGAQALTKVGGNGLVLMSANNYSGATTINDGKVTLTSGGAITASAVAVNAGTSLLLDNTSSELDNRLGGANTLTINGNFTLKGNSNGTTELISTTGKTINFGNGGSVLTLVPDPNPFGFNNGLLFGVSNNTAFTRTAGATTLVRGDGLGSSGGANQTSSSFVNPAGATLTNGGSVTTFAFTGIGQQGGAATLNRAILPWMLVDGSSTGSGTSFATYSTLNGYTALVPTGINAEAASAFTGSNIPNVILAASGSANSGVVPFGQFSANSLTLGDASGAGGGGATATINAGSALLLDSGGLLAFSNNTGISGGGVLTTNAGSRELIAHVVGASTTLSIQPKIYTSGGLTKADAGSLVLQSQELYTGSTTINGGVLQLASNGDNTIFSVYTVPANPGATVATASGQNTVISTGASLDLFGFNQALHNLSSPNPTPLQGGTVVNTSLSAPSTLHISPNGNQTWSGNMGGSAFGTLNFVRDGNNTFTVNSPNSLGGVDPAHAGTATFTGGATRLIDLGTFAASAVTVTRAALIWDDSGVQAVPNRLPSTSPITLNGGGLQFVGRAALGANPVDSISLGQLNLGTGASSVVPSGLNQGGALAVTFASLGSRATGGTLNFAGGGGALGDNPQVFFTNAPALTNGMIGGWATTTGVGGEEATGAATATFATYDPTTGVRGIQYQPSGTYGSGVNALLLANSTLPSGGATVNSLNLYNAITLSFAAANDTLTVQSGGIIFGLDATAKALGSTALPGQLVSGPGNDLYVHVGNNTATINAKIIDNGSSNNLIVDGLSTANTATLQLTNANTYGGTTFVSGATLLLNSSVGPAIPHDLILSGGNNGAADSLAFNQTNVQLSQANQIATSSNVTMNGASQLNLNGFNNTIASLTINNDGGSNGGQGPVVTTGAGMLTITGGLNAVNPAETFTVATINGFLNLSSGVVSVDANTYNAGQIGLALNANLSGPALTKNGSGYLGIGGQSSNFTGPVTINGGGIAFSAPNAVLGGRVTVNGGASLDTRGFSATIGSLSGTGTVTNINPAAAGTLVVGLDGTSTIFSGALTAPFSAALLNLTKIGSGNLNLTADNSGAGLVSPNLGNYIGNGGSLTLNTGSARVGFTNYTINAGSSINLDNSTNAVSNRLGGAFPMASATVTAATPARGLTLQGGALTLIGSPSTDVNEALGNASIANGASTITIQPDQGGITAISLNTVSNMFNSGALGGTLLVRGANLGGTPMAGNTNVTVTGAVPYTSNTNLMQLAGIGGGAGTNSISIRPDIIGDNSANGTGTGFVTYGLNGFRLLSGVEVQPTVPSLGSLSYVTIANGSQIGFMTSTAGLVIGEGISSPAGVAAGIPLNDVVVAIDPDGKHFTLAAPATASATLPAALGLVAGTNAASSQSTSYIGATTLNSLVIGGGTTFSSAGAGVAGQNFSPSGGGNLLTVFSGGVLVPASATPTTFSGGALAPGSNYQLIIHAVGDLNMNANLFGNGAQGFTKSGAGKLTINQPAYYTTATNINAGTVVLNSGQANTIMVTPTASTPTVIDLRMNGGLLDLNGNTQAVGAISSINFLPGQGGNITSTAPANLITSTSTGTSYGGAIGGALSFYKSGSATLTLTNASGYTGPTTVSGGTLTLRDSGALTSTNAVNLNFATLTQDNTGLSDSTARIPAAVPLNFSGGTLTTSARQANADLQNLGPLNLLQGANAVSIALYNNLLTGAYTQNFASLNRSAGTTINFTNSGGQYGSGTTANAGANPAIFFGAAPALTNNLIGGWAVINGTNFASYSPTRGIGEISNTGAGFANYDGTDLTAGTVTQNINDGTSRSLAANRTLNSLRLGPTATQNIALSSSGTATSGAPVTLTLQSGGLLTNGNVAIGIGVANGTYLSDTSSAITSGTSELDAFINQSTTTIGAKIIDGAGPVTLVKSGPATLSLTSANNYTGGTIVNQGTLSLNGATASSVIPGNLTINNATVTMVGNAGQISPASAVTVNGGGVLTLVGNNTLNSLVFNGTGGTGTPTVTTGGTLTLTNGITAMNDNFATTPALAGVLDITGQVKTVTVNSGVSTMGLRINAVVQGAGGSLIKTGGGTLVMTATNTFDGGVTINDGGLIVDNNTNPLGTGPLVVGDPVNAPASGNITLLAGTGARTLSNPVTVNQDFTFGGTLGANSVTLGGAVSIPSTRVITVSDPNLTDTNQTSVTATISGKITAGAGLTKAGPGLLVLSNATNVIPGPLVVSGGILRPTVAGAIPGGANVTVSAGAVLDLSGTTQVLNTLLGSGMVTNSGGAAATLAVGGTTLLDRTTAQDNVINAVLTNGAQPLGITSVGTGTVSLANPNNNYTGPTTVNSGTLQTTGAGIFSPFSAIALGNATAGANASIGTIVLGNSPNVTLGGLTGQVDSSALGPVTVNIGTGKTMTLMGPLTSGFNALSGLPSTNFVITGGGTLQVTASVNVNVGVTQTVATTIPTTATLDLSGLSNVLLGTQDTPLTGLLVAFGSADSGTLLLSNSANTIIANSISVGNTGPGANSGVGQLTLGAGTNVVETDALNIGLGKSSGTVSFASTSGSGSVTIANRLGTGPAAITVGSQNGTSTGALLTGVLDLRGHNASVNAGTVNIGINDNPNNVGNATGTIFFDTGTFNAGAVNVGVKSGNNTAATGSGTANLELSGGVFNATGLTTVANNSFAVAAAGTNITGNIDLSGGTLNANGLVVATKTGAGTGAATGIVNVTGGTLNVLPGSSFILGSNTSGAGSASATLSISGGTVTSNVDIATQGGAATTAKVSLAGSSATLDLTGHALGSALLPIQFVLTTGTLNNLGELNGGASAGAILDKTGLNTVTMGSGNAYTAVTQIDGGILQVAKLSPGGSPSGIGASTNAASNLVLNGGVLSYTGSGDTTDRNFTLGAGGGVLDASGTGAVIFSNTAPIALLGTNTASTLTLTGTNTAANTLNDAITNNGTGATKVTKAGRGVWVLGGANTYSGDTTVSAGTLRVALGGSLTGATTVKVSNTASFEANGTVSGGAINVSSGGALRGAGVINENATIAAGGILAPGAGGPGSLTIGGNLTLQNTATTAPTYLYDAASTGTNTSSSDRVVLSLGTGLTLPSANSPINLTLTNAGLTAPLYSTVNFVLFDGPAGGPNINGGNPGVWKINYGTTGWAGGTVQFDSVNNDIVLSGVIIPEPTPASFLLGGVGVLLGLQRFRRRSKA